MAARSAIVIGGGVIGCSIAYHLAGAGCETVLLERAESEQELRAIRQATYSGRPLGSKQFIAGLEEKLGRKLEARLGGRTKEMVDRCADQLEF